MIRFGYQTLSKVLHNATERCKELDKVAKRNSGIFKKYILIARA